ncbi:MAG: hypothetical protein EOP06_30950, partial [Proteobacteria bacterium]
MLFSRLYNAFNPLLPATEDEYVPTEDVRGNEVLAKFFLTHLRLSKSYMSLPFSGHIGGGKSSELNHLATCLRKPHPSTKGKRYLPIKLDILDYLDVYNATTTDILLAIVSEIGHVFRTDVELKVELKESYLSNRFSEFKEFLFSDIEIKEGDLTLGKLKAKIQLLKSDPRRRNEIRKAFDTSPSEFQAAINM